MPFLHKILLMCNHLWYLIKININLIERLIIIKMAPEILKGYDEKKTQISQQLKKIWLFENLKCYIKIWKSV